MAGYPGFHVPGRAGPLIRGPDTFPVGKEAMRDDLVWCVIAEKENPPGIQDDAVEV